ncbi:MAG: winged helix DNA-binding domain-containing protein [Chloroflexi bacterium]|nr:MAG: winged helix DNA-binding domain-containing protein [Chloroflexota bacterium]
MSRRIGVEERRARLGVRHLLACEARAGAAIDVADALVALHSTDPATVYLSAAARLREPDAAAVERALYEERTLVRILGMRRTIFVVRRELVAVVHAACTRAIAADQRRLLAKTLRDFGGIADADAWLRRVEEATLRVVRERGEVYGADVSAEVPELRTQILMNEGKKYEGMLNLTTRVLFLLSADERIVRGRPRGSWVSTQFKWSPMEAWLPDGVEEVAAEAARAELVRRWLRAYGPGTAADVRWWTGWAARDVTRALRDVGAVEVELDEGPGFVLGDDVDPVPAPAPWVRLLPALDPTVMGWIGRGWFLGEHGKLLFDGTGNAGPTVWCDGRVAGAWARRPDGEVAFRLLEDVGAEATRAVEAEAARLSAWIGTAALAPRGRGASPLERELSG